MPFSKRTQKQVAERLKGNLDYYDKPHPWRTLRLTISALSLLLGIAMVPAYYYFHAPEFVMNPGPISRGHARIANDCAACHPQTNMIRRDTHEAGNIVRTEYFVPIDQACAKCHAGYAFHQPNVAPDPTRPAGTGAQNETSSCTSCHREHITSGKMLPTTDQHCAACHDRADLMAASSEIGRSLSSKAFPSGNAKRADGLLYFYKSRPPEGYTAKIAAFDQGHPEFQIHTKHLTDPDTLKYNHARHLAVGLGIPKSELGTRLDCDYCHKPDAGGKNFQKISFEQHCMSCHALAFDPNLSSSKDVRDPGLVIPHGDPEKVRAFLRTLANQYLEYAIRHDGANPVQAQAFMTKSIQKLAESYGFTGANIYQAGPVLERKVFYNADPQSTGASALRRRTEGGGGRGQESTYFPGCALCHQVSPPVPNVTPTITHAVIFDRWLGDGRFDHSKHQQQSCAQCHTSIHTSEKTSDINIPTQRSCTECHNSSLTGVANDCLSCHGYHNDPRRRTLNRKDVEPVKTVDPTFTSSDGTPPTGLRAMILDAGGVLSKTR